MKMAEQPNPDVFGSNASELASEYNCVVVKAGTNVLTGGKDELDLSIMKELVRQLAWLHSRGIKVLLVTSGAIAAGRKVLGMNEDKNDMSYRQMLAAVGQSRLLQLYSSLFETWGIIVAQALLTRNDLSDRQGYLNVRNILHSLLSRGVIPIINENDVVALEEIGPVFGDNDTLSALVVNLVDADLLAILTDTNGLFTADPNKDMNATILNRVERVDSYIESLAGKHDNQRSRGGMASKLRAAKMATRLGTTVVICNGLIEDIVPRIVLGQAIGTLFVPTSNKMESRKRWMLSGLSIKGDIYVDNGAEHALAEDNKSLLPAGVNNVSGDFRRGDVVSIKNVDGVMIACGLTNYDAPEISKMKGQRSETIQAVIDNYYGQEVVHRNNMVLL
jgi:glutamate 5-kinase